MLNALKEQPFVVLLLGQTSVEFLCDTGACRTVLKDHVPNVQSSKTSLWVSAANGQVQKEFLSKPISVTDPETHLTTTAPVIISSKCPINLLGRDLMQKLKLAIVPTADGMRVHRVDSICTYQYHPPTLYTSLDVHPRKQANPFETADLIRTAKQPLSCPKDEIGYDHLHVTMALHYDPEEVTAFTHLAPVTMATDYLFTDKVSFSAVTVLLPDTILPFFTLSENSVPHLSLMKADDASWKNTGPRLKVAVSATDWEPGTDLWSYSASCGLWRTPLVRVLYAEPGVHPLAD